MVWDGIAQGGRCLGAVTRSTEVFYRRRLLDRAAKFRERGVYNVYEERLSVHRIAPPTGTAHRMALSKLSAAQARCGDVSPGTRLMHVAASRDPTASRAGAERECAVRGVPRTGVLRRVARECLWRVCRALGTVRREAFVGGQLAVCSPFEPRVADAFSTA
jgi:hypothetical protein